MNKFTTDRSGVTGAANDNAYVGVAVEPQSDADRKHAVENAPVAVAAANDPKRERRLSANVFADPAELVRHAIITAKQRRYMAQPIPSAIRNLIDAAVAGGDPTAIVIGEWLDKNTTFIKRSQAEASAASKENSHV
jgi:hypothetical protein